MAAVWIAADLSRAVPLPDPARMRQLVAEQLAFMDVATDTHHCHGGKIIPFSMHNVDEVLGDLGVNISARTRAWHWLMPVDPAAYREITPAVLRRLPSPAASAAAPAGRPRRRCRCPRQRGRRRSASGRASARPGLTAGWEAAEASRGRGD